MDMQFVRARLHLALKRTLGRLDEDLMQAIVARGVSHRRQRVLVFGVGERNPVIFIQLETTRA